MAECDSCGYEAEQHDRFSTGLPAPLQELALAVLHGSTNAGVMPLSIAATTAGHDSRSSNKTNNNDSSSSSSRSSSSSNSSSSSSNIAAAMPTTTAAANRNKTAVVLVHGGALALEEVKASAAAILDAHYPGAEHGAAAVADALFGV